MACAHTGSLQHADQSAARPGQKKFREVVAQNPSFDVKAGEIEYTLPEDALVRIRIGVANGGPLLIILKDWEQQTQGPHTEVWDRKDGTGKIFFNDDSNLMVVIACITPDQRNPSTGSELIKGFHFSPSLEILFPEVHRDPSRDIVDISDVVPVRVLLNEQDKEWMTETRYEVAFYLDQILLFEDEEGTNPYTYFLNTKGINDGEHLLTVNVIGYSGEIGTKSVKVFVKNS